MAENGGGGGCCPPMDLFRSEPISIRLTPLTTVDRFLNRVAPSRLGHGSFADYTPCTRPCSPCFTTLPPSYEEVNNTSISPVQNGSNHGVDYFLREVMFSYNAESDVELNLSSGDYVVIRKVANNGWAEGECKGKAGWFPFEYIKRRERVLASKVTEVF